MYNIPKRETKPFHRIGDSGLEFDPKATEVAILDRSGKPIWKTAKGDTPAPIRWDGSDFTGQTVQTGDYICKISYADDKVAYLPFVFMKKK
jgi:flagellar hook assembly protein FlgD